MPAEKLMWIMGSILVISIGTILSLYVKMKTAANKKPPNNVPFLIILGAKVNGSVLSNSLYQRAVTGIEYLKENPSTKAVVTGGQGRDESISEGEALAAFLLKHGINKNRILIEKKSVTTFENIAFSKKNFKLNEAVIVSNDFHVYRAVQIARAQGIKAFPLGAKTPGSVKAKLYAREYLAIIKWEITGK
jgi:uncharacterized SAM-binding protein YcdF (DUF218 family)